MSGFIGKLRSALLPPGLILFGVIMFFGAQNEAETSKAMADHGKVATAQVTAIKWKEKGLTKREKSFKADIAFETEDKQTITATVDVPTSLGKDIRDDKKDAALEVKYLPENPHKIVLGDHTDDSGMMYAIAVALVLAGLGIGAYRLRRGKLAAA